MIFLRVGLTLVDGPCTHISIAQLLILFLFPVTVSQGNRCRHFFLVWRGFFSARYLNFVMQVSDLYKNIDSSACKVKISKTEA